ncbi:MAG: putative motif domain protein [Gammaproteobacteria bacterium]|nr:putative motif domain protein [Gammaproteobacteria bacterium]
MRSRYTAYTRANINYIASTQAGEAAEGFNTPEAKQWALAAKWLGLKVLNTHLGFEQDTSGTVEFIATFKLHGKIETIHEHSHFHKVNEKWLYTGQSID